MHGLPISCPFNFPNGNLKQQLSHIGVFICYQNIDPKNKLNLHIYGIHLLNPHKTVVSHLNPIRSDAAICIQIEEILNSWGILPSLTLFMLQNKGDINKELQNS